MRREVSSLPWTPESPPPRAGLPPDDADRVVKNDPFPTSIYDIGTSASGITVRAVHPYGSPAPGKRVVIRNRKREHLAEGVTGEDGEFLIESPPARRVKVFHIPEQGFAEYLIGTWHRRSPRLVLFTVYPVRTLIARITVDGEPMLPNGLRFTGTPLVDLTRDEHAHTIVARYLPRQRRTTIRAAAPGLISASSDVEFDADATVSRCALPLLRECRLRVRVHGDRRHASLLRLTRFEIDGSWKERGEFQPYRRDDQEKRWVAEYVVPTGTYRISTPNDRIVLQEFTANHGVNTIDVDLRSAGMVEVRVVAPPPLNRPASTLQAFVGTPGRSIYSRQEFFHPGDRPVVVRAAVAMMRPHPTLGERTVRKPGGVVTVHAEVAPRIRFVWRPPSMTAVPIADVPDLVIREREEWFFLGPASPMLAVDLRPVGNSELTRTYALRLEKPSQYEFVTPLDGRFDLLVQEPGGATVLLPDVDLRGAVDLGTLQAKSAHNVTVVARHRPRRSFLDITAHDPGSGFDITTARIHSAHNATILRGLPAGRLELRFRLGTEAWTQEIDCADGKAQVVEIDCSK